MLFKIEPALINKVVGYIASHRMVEGYQYDSPLSVRNINRTRGKLNFDLNMHSIELLKRSKPMDLITSVPVSHRGLIISQKLWELFSQYSLPKELQVFSASAIHKNVKYPYQYFYLYESNENLIIDWEKSRFKLCKLTTLYGDEFRVDIDEIRKTIARGEGIQSFDPIKLVIQGKSHTVGYYSVTIF